MLIGGGTETSLRLLSYLFRLSDRFLHTRMSVYGWALYFGNVETPIDCRTFAISAQGSALIFLNRAGTVATVKASGVTPFSTSSQNKGVATVAPTRARAE